MWRRHLSGGISAMSHCLRSRSFSASTSATSNAVDSIILRSLKDHYLEISKISPPPKVNPPSSYTIIKGALDKNGPVLRRTYNDDEQISLSVMRLETLIPAGADKEATGGNNLDDSINQLLLHVEVSKEGREESLHFLCGLYPDAVGIHSVSLRPKIGKEIGEKVGPENLSKYQGRVFQELDPKVRDALHMYIEARGINEDLFPFLQAWLHVKDLRKLMNWFKSVGTLISERNQA